MMCISELRRYRFWTAQEALKGAEIGRLEGKSRNTANDSDRDHCL
jgi:hypothetical protein